MSAHVASKDGEVVIDKGGFHLFLDREEALDVARQILADFDRPAAVPEVQQPGTHRVPVHVVWSEVALYAQDVEIDVPDGFTGDPADLLDVNDSEFDDEQWQELGVDPATVPDNYTSNWLKRVDFGSPKEISERQFHDSHVLGTSERS